MSMPMYASAEQIMRDKTDYARKGIARGRSVIVLSTTDGVVLIAENPSSTLHKVGEIYDRIGFAAVGRYNEFENLRQAGIRYADTRGFAYDRRDVTGRGLANAYAQTLGTIFSEQLKPFEVEICVAEVGPTPDDDQLYRLTFDGSVVDEPSYVAMGGQSDAVTAALKSNYSDGLGFDDAIRLAVQSLSTSTPDGSTRDIPSANLEVAVLERGRDGRSFRRLTAAAIDEILGLAAGSADADTTTAESAKPGKPDSATTPAPASEDTRDDDAMETGGESDQPRDEPGV